MSPISLAAVVLAASISAAAPVVANDDVQLPPEVTPRMRAACESDVRRLCIGENPTVAKVKACVASKFMQLGRRCQVELAMAGFKP
jgi:hypothetical protein